MAALASRLGVALILARTGVVGRCGSLYLVGPVLDVGHPEKVALSIDDEHGLHTVAEPMETLDSREPGVEPRGPLGIDSLGVRRVAIASQQERPRREAPVLVSG